MSADISEIPASAESIFGWDELNIEQELFDDIPSSLFEPEDIDLPSEMPEVENVPSSSTASPVQSQSTKKRKDKKKKTSKELDIDNSVAQSEIDVVRKLAKGPSDVEIKRQQAIEIDPDEIEDRVYRINQIAFKEIIHSSGLSIQEQLTTLMKCRDWLKQRTIQNPEVSSMMEDNLSIQIRRYYGINVPPQFEAELMKYMLDFIQSDDCLLKEEEEFQKLKATHDTNTQNSISASEATTIASSGTEERTSSLEGMDSDVTDSPATTTSSAASDVSFSEDTMMTGDRLVFFSDSEDEGDMEENLEQRENTTASSLSLSNQQHQKLCDHTRGKEVDATTTAADKKSTSALEQLTSLLPTSFARYLQKESNVNKKGPSNSVDSHHRARSEFLFSLRKKACEARADNYCKQYRISRSALDLRVDLQEKCRQLVENLQIKRDRDIQRKRQLNFQTARKNMLNSKNDDEEEEFDDDYEYEEILTDEQRIALLKSRGLLKDEEEDEEDEEEMEEEADEEEEYLKKERDDEDRNGSGEEEGEDEGDEDNDNDDDDDDGNDEENGPQGNDKTDSRRMRNNNTSKNSGSRLLEITDQDDQDNQDQDDDDDEVVHGNRKNKSRRNRDWNVDDLSNELMMTKEVDNNDLPMEDDREDVRKEPQDQQQQIVKKPSRLVTFGRKNRSAEDSSRLEESEDPFSSSMDNHQQVDEDENTSSTGMEHEKDVDKNQDEGMTDSKISKSKTKGKEFKNSLYRLSLLQEEEQYQREQARKKSMGASLIEAEVEEEEEGGQQAGLGDYGFTFAKKDEEDENLFRLRKEDMLDIVDEVSDDEGDEQMGRERRRREEELEDLRLTKEIISNVTEGRKSSRTGSAKGSAAEFSFDSLTMDQNEDSYNKALIQQSSTEEKEENWDDFDESEYMNRLMDKRRNKEQEIRAMRSEFNQLESDDSDDEEDGEELKALDSSMLSAEESAELQLKIQRHKEMKRLNRLRSMQFEKHIQKKRTLRRTLTSNGSLTSSSAMTSMTGNYSNGASTSSSSSSSPSFVSYSISPSSNLLVSSHGSSMTNGFRRTPSLEKMSRIGLSRSSSISPLGASTSSSSSNIYGGASTPRGSDSSSPYFNSISTSLSSAVGTSAAAATAAAATALSSSSLLSTNGNVVSNTTSRPKATLARTSTYDGQLTGWDLSSTYGMGMAVPFANRPVAIGSNSTDSSSSSIGQKDSSHGFKSGIKRSHSQTDGFVEIDNRNRGLKRVTSFDNKGSR